MGGEADVKVKKKLGDSFCSEQREAGENGTAVLRWSVVGRVQGCFGQRCDFTAPPFRRGAAPDVCSLTGFSFSCLLVSGLSADSKPTVRNASCS